jgi:signal transduction histidine kinase
MDSSHVAIDWSTAGVVPAEPLFELRVRLAPVPLEREWRDRFNDLAKRQALDVRTTPRWGAVELTDETIVVSALEPAADGAIAALLQALVARTNEEIESDRLARIEAERREAEERAERERIARELTERFRTPSAPPPEPAPLPSGPFRAVG